MDILICDELIHEIFLRLPPSSAAAVSLVSKRWRRLLRCSITSLHVNFPPPYHPSNINGYCSFLSDHPFLSSLSLSSDVASDDHLLLSAAFSCPNLRHLRYLSHPVSPLSLFSVSASCAHLSSISITLSRPLSFHWLRFVASLKYLSLSFTNPLTEIDCGVEETSEAFDVELSLMTLSLSGIRCGDYCIGFLWRNCKILKKLQLKSCESLGDYSSFVKSLKDLEELELKACRSIVDGVLLKLAENCTSLDSLLVYDGGSRSGLLQFIHQSKCSLRKLDFRLPLDLDNTHMIGLARNVNFRGLVSLRLQSCCLVTGEGLKGVARAVNIGLEELALINCDVVERESGLLTSMGQELKNLRRLDLSYNESLIDKELASMLASCSLLIELRLRGCNRLSDAGVASVVRNCKHLQIVDIAYCSGIEMAGVEFLLHNSRRLRELKVEQKKLSSASRAWARSKSIELES